MQFTINIPDAHVQRVADWIRGTLPEFEDGTVDPIAYTNAELLLEFRRQIRRWIREEVQQHELLAEHEQVFQQYTPIDVEDA